MAENTENTEYTREQLKKDLADALEKNKLLLQQLNFVLKTHQAQAAQLAAQQAENVAQATQLAAQQAKLFELETFRDAAIRQFGTGPTFLTQVLLEMQGCPGCLAPIYRVDDYTILRSILDETVSQELEWLVSSCEDETDDDFHCRAVNELIVFVAEAAREIHEQNNHALIFGMTASHLSSILEVATATGELIQIRSQFAKAELTPEWKAWFNRWVAEDAAFQDESLSASQAQPSSVGKQQIPCRNWAATGDCPWGDSCRFAHVG